MLEVLWGSLSLSEKHTARDFSIHPCPDESLLLLPLPPGSPPRCSRQDLHPHSTCGRLGPPPAQSPRLPTGSLLAALDTPRRPRILIQVDATQSCSWWGQGTGVRSWLCLNWPCDLGPPFPLRPQFPYLYCKRVNYNDNKS